MCGRYVSPEQAAIERQWHIGRHSQPTLSEPFAARYNVAPQQGNPANYIPVVRQADNGELELVRLQWWLLPFWSKEPRIKYSTFNARVETVAKAASFREPLKHRRCIIPALGWYEWQELRAEEFAALRGADRGEGCKTRTVGG
jgi:putative SOS response-associated peptidase YedK